MDSEDLRIVSVISETPDVFTNLDESDDTTPGVIEQLQGVIEQLPPKSNGVEGETVGELMPESEEEDEFVDSVKSPKSDFVCVRKHACDNFLKLMFPGWDTPNVSVGIDGSIPEIEMAFANKGKGKESHGKKRKKEDSGVVKESAGKEKMKKEERKK